MSHASFEEENVDRHESTRGSNVGTQSLPYATKLPTKPSESFPWNYSLTFFRDLNNDARATTLLVREHEKQATVRTRVSHLPPVKNRWSEFSQVSACAYEQQ